jgi:iron complex outermembrane recepter protein
LPAVIIKIKIFFMRKLFLSLTLIFSGYLVFAQQSFTIKVVDAKNGNPITGASVVVRSTGKGASSNTDGSYTLLAKAGDIADVTSVGYKPQMIRLSAAVTTVLLEEQLLDLGDIVVIGTRGAARAKTETAVPIDVIKINQVGQPTAKLDLTSALNIAAPSFNYNKQSGADGADHIELGTLRGLGPDQTLVLINGKRRHTTAYVALFGTRGRGASGTDLNGFAQNAVDRIEILRDGASAQYGSDAMAGVMNIVLKKNINQWSINAGWSGYYDTKFNARKFNKGNEYYSDNTIDGGGFNLSANNGFAIGKSGGFINLSFDFLSQNKTYRQVDTLNWQTSKDALPYLNTGRRAMGDASVKSYGAMYNMELPVKGSTAVFYSFGGTNNKSGDAFAYTRNMSARPDRFPVDNTGAPVFVQGIMRRTTGGEVFYNPHIVSEINDASVVLGMRGVGAKGWHWDASLANGKNDFQYFGDKTFNATLIGNTSKTYFIDGGFRFRQTTINLDFSKSFKTVANGLNVGYGFEYRNEKYSINKGEEASYASYPNNFGQAPGSQGFPGFSPNDTIKATRNNFSAYVDGELNVTSKWLVDGAVRLENYSDFGSVATFKLASRIKAADNFNIRGSVSTGFRAPSLAQINFSNTLTSFSAGQLIQSRIARNGDAVSKAAGIPNLKEETSLNASLGFAWKPAKGFTVTVDGYGVKVKDRVVLSGLFSESDPTLPTALTNQLRSLGVATAQFFANAVNTTNYGLDVIADYSTKWENKSFKILLAGNLQTVKVDKINVPAALNSTVLNQKTFYSDREVSFLKASAPKSKFNLSSSYGCGKLSAGINLTYYGAVQLLGFGTPTAENPNYGGINPQVPSDANGSLIPEVFDYKARLVTDVHVSYKLTKCATLFIGADNVLNAHPAVGVNQLAKQGANGNESGGPWDSVQMGFNGRRLFTKLAFNF